MSSIQLPANGKPRPSASRPLNEASVYCAIHKELRGPSLFVFFAPVVKKLGHPIKDGLLRSGSGKNARQGLVASQHGRFHLGEKFARFLQMAMFTVLLQLPETGLQFQQPQIS